MLNSYLTARNYIRNGSNLSVSVGLNVMNACYYSVRNFPVSYKKGRELCIFVGYGTVMYVTFYSC